MTYLKCFESVKANNGDIGEAPLQLKCTNSINVHDEQKNDENSQNWDC